MIGSLQNWIFLKIGRFLADTIYAAGSGYQGDDYIEDTKAGRDWRWRLFMKAPNEVKAFENIAIPEAFPNAPLITSSDTKFSTATGYPLGKGFSHNYTMQVLNEDRTAKTSVII
ncbi:MAG TPA: hypothetical protein DEQ06_08405 [Porphyromonadaceae bacterium]|jgi:hypothetical protein|nr:hypothetical protein [Porphyromonadaceae bacterium]